MDKFFFLTLSDISTVIINFMPWFSRSLIAIRLTSCLWHNINLIDQFRVEMMGIIRQELLSGIKSKSQFNRLKSYLRAFPDLEMNTEIHELAAQYFNLCRKKGIQGSHVDFLICASAKYYESMIFTSDKDFELYAQYLPITLYSSL